MAKTHSKPKKIDIGSGDHFQLGSKRNINRKKNHPREPGNRQIRVEFQEIRENILCRLTRSTAIEKPDTSIKMIEKILETNNI